jgi:hypothetical protein
MAAEAAAYVLREASQADFKNIIGNLAAYVLREASQADFKNIIGIFPSTFSKFRKNVKEYYILGSYMSYQNKIQSKNLTEYPVIQIPYLEKPVNIFTLL